MKLRYLLIGVAVAALSGPAMATPVNILPGSGATVTGSNIYPGFNAGIAAGNLINGTSNPAYFNTDSRWVFADGQSSVQTLIVNLGSSQLFDYAGFSYGGLDRIPTSFSVLTSPDGITFNLLAGPSATTPADYGSPILYTRGLSFAPTSAQWVEYDFGADSYGGLCPGCGGGPGQGAGIVQLFLETNQAVPEPMTLSLFGAGLAGVAALRRRKKKTA